MAIQIIKTIQVGAARVNALHDGGKFSVEVVEGGKSRSVSDWTDLDSAVYVMKFVIVALRGRQVK